VGNPESDAAGPPRAPGDPPAPSPSPPDFSAVYHEWFHDVCRWARSLGCPDADIEDVAQEVFVTVQRRLPDFKEGKLSSWLYTITARATRDHRRRAWFRHLLRPRESIEMDRFALSAPGPAERLERLEDRRLLARLLAGLSDKKRTVLLLFEVEGYTGEEIAALQGVPVDTVWTRLHTARRELKAKLLRIQRREPK
jgi:RNA polymerase sigma-70 factor, ECF subfamily